jgi:hypothetical protein
MGTRAEELAQKLEQVNQECIEAVAGAQNGGLSAICPVEGWTAAALGAHIAGGHTGILESLIKPAIEGREIPPFSLADFDAPNAKAAAENVAMPQEQVLAMLREHGTQAAAYLRLLSDDDLDRPTKFPSMGDQPVTAQQLIEWVLIGHPAEHGQSLRQGLAETSGL